LPSSPPLGFEKQLGLAQNAFANHGRTFAPSGIQLTGLPCIAVIPGEYRSHPLAILEAEAGYRHQKLHRRVRQDFALSYLLLDRLRQKLDQGLTTRYPAHAAVEAPRQLIQSVAEALL
jgi:hypothetical protein